MYGDPLPVSSTARVHSIGLRSKILEHRVACGKVPSVNDEDGAWVLRRGHMRVLRHQICSVPGAAALLSTVERSTDRLRTRHLRGGPLAPWRQRPCDDRDAPRLSIAPLQTAQSLAQELPKSRLRTLWPLLTVVSLTARRILMPRQAPNTPDLARGCCADGCHLSLRAGRRHPTASCRRKRSVRWRTNKGRVQTPA